MSYDPVDAPSPSSPSLPQVPLRTLDEARVEVVRLAMGSIKQAAVDLAAHLEKAEDKTSNEYLNGQTMLAAVKEFVEGAKATILALERPRILRPERSRKIFRG